VMQHYFKESRKGGFEIKLKQCNTVSNCISHEEHSNQDTMSGAKVVSPYTAVSP
jgi:hypothetical protein